MSDDVAELDRAVDRLMRACRFDCAERVAEIREHIIKELRKQCKLVKNVV